MQISLNREQWITMQKLRRWIEHDITDAMRMPQGGNRDYIVRELRNFQDTIDQLVPSTPPR